MVTQTFYCWKVKRSLIVETAEKVSLTDPQNKTAIVSMRAAQEQLNSDWKRLTRQ